MVEGPRALPKFHTDPPPRPSLPEGGGFTENLSRGLSKERGEGRGRGRGGVVSVWNLGSVRGPFIVKKRPLFDENALKPGFVPGTCESVRPVQVSRTPKSGKEGCGVKNRAELKVTHLR